VLAEACGEQTYTTIFATSSVVASRWTIELLRCSRTNPIATWRGLTSGGLRPLYLPSHFTLICAYSPLALLRYSH